MNPTDLKQGTDPADLEERKDPTDDEVAQAVFILFIEAARAAGMPDERAREIHDEVAMAFSRMKPEFPKAFVDQIEKAVARRPRNH